PERRRRASRTTSWALGEIGACALGVEASSRERGRGARRRGASGRGAAASGAGAAGEGSRGGDARREARVPRARDRGTPHGVGPAEAALARSLPGARGAGIERAIAPVEGRGAGPAEGRD